VSCFSTSLCCVAPPRTLCGADGDPLPPLPPQHQHQLVSQHHHQLVLQHAVQQAVQQAQHLLAAAVTGAAPSAQQQPLLVQQPESDASADQLPSAAPLQLAVPGTQHTHHSQHHQQQQQLGVGYSAAAGGAGGSSPQVLSTPADAAGRHAARDQQHADPSHAAVLAVAASPFASVPFEHFGCPSRCSLESACSALSGATEDGGIGRGAVPRRVRIGGESAAAPAAGARTLTAAAAVAAAARRRAGESAVLGAGAGCSTCGLPLPASPGSGGLAAALALSPAPPPLRLPQLAPPPSALSTATGGFEPTFPPLSPASPPLSGPAATAPPPSACSGAPLALQPSGVQTPFGGQSVADLPQSLTRAYTRGRFSVQEGVLLLDTQPSGGPAAGAGPAAPLLGAAGSPFGGAGPCCIGGGFAGPEGAGLPSASSLWVGRSASLPDSTTLGLSAALPCAAAAAAAAAGAWGPFAAAAALQPGTCVAAAGAGGELPPLAEEEVGPLEFEPSSWGASPWGAALAESSSLEGSGGGSPARRGDGGGGGCSSSSPLSVASAGRCAAAPAPCGAPAAAIDIAKLLLPPGVAAAAHIPGCVASPAPRVHELSRAASAGGAPRRAASAGGAAAAAAAAAAGGVSGGCERAGEARRPHSVLFFRRGRFLVSASSYTPVE
jgi:hypothetical protein